MTETTLKRLLQIGIVVPDAPQAAKNFCTLFAPSTDARSYMDSSILLRPALK